ncbi:ABC transporter ATP-binding protein [Puniceibacterium sediminis]|uniref:ATP-binding cassette, subfamily B n=1 Tax=Puniceibacterium sediminis TaxID=1608407 RepID=A0A238YXZ0_9RHOB|nr:ABC transporter ATP-binding protein [Puniceibacterium sediminis]SNR75503.1 ATP-binding cassette, subfamily B [Puniceibacterium sediminis]
MAKDKTVSAGQAVSTARRLVSEALATRWKLFAISLICMLGVAAFTGALAYSTRLIVNDVFVDENTNKAIWVALLVIGVSIGKSFFQYANSVIAVLFDRSISAHYQKRIFKATIAKNVEQFAGKHGSTQMSQIKILGKACGSSVINLCNKMLTDTLTLIALFGVMLFQDPVMTLVGSTLIPIIFWLVAHLSKRVRAAANAETELTGAFFSLGTEAIDGIKTVKSYQLEGKSIRRFEAAVDKLEERLFGIAKVTSATVPIMELLGGVVIGLFVIYAAWQTVNHGKTPGEFTAFITAFLMAYQPAERISKIWVELQKTLVQAGRMYDLLDEKPTLRTDGTTEIDDSVASVSFRDVSFAYGKKVPALNRVSFEAVAGQRIAIVGRSGAGKSTLIDLIQRFYDPTEGVIEIDGINLREIKEESLRRNIALISQDVFLFDGSIRDNIRDGNVAATDAQIEQAARLAQLGDLIAEAPQGLDSQVGPNGRALSGGQKQRVGIARAFVKNAKIYIFDEATSALDGQTERAVMEALDEALSDATAFFVTHRASTLEHVDKVILLDGGHLVAFDTPQSLLETNPLFGELFEPSQGTKQGNTPVLNGTRS